MHLDELLPANPHFIKQMPGVGAAQSLLKYRLCSRAAKGRRDRGLLLSGHHSQPIPQGRPSPSSPLPSSPRSYGWIPKHLNIRTGSQGSQRRQGRRMHGGPAGKSGCMGSKVGVRNVRQTTGRAGRCAGAYDLADYKFTRAPPPPPQR